MKFFLVLLLSIVVAVLGAFGFDALMSSSDLDPMTFEIGGVVFSLRTVVVGALVGLVIGALFARE